MLSLQCDINTSESLQGLRGKNELCDVVIVSSGGQQTFAHSCVLACHSSVIASVLQNRLTAQHDWSVLRPLIINIDEVSMKASSQQDMTREVNIIEILISLMYGEVVNIADTHVPALNEFAHVLGLSEQIFASLDGNEGKNFQPGECDENSKTKTSPPKSVLVFSSNSQGKDGAEENAHVEEISEITLANDIFPNSLSKESQEKADESVVESLSGRNQPENLLSFSMLCSESQDDDSNSSKNWNEGDLQYEKHSSTQDQGCNVIICKMEQSGSDESVGRHVTSISKDSQDGSICNVTGNVSDILNITGNAQSHASAYCGETQQLQQQKKQARKSMTCTTCGSAFQKCGDFVKHVLNNQHFTVQCPLCFIQVEDSEGQRLHFALHNQELPFFCVYCDLRFRTRAALTMHTPKHMTSKPFVCNECGRGFKWRHALHAHLYYTHSPTSLLLCDICGFSSKYVSSFKAHLLQHSGKLFPCPHPGCSFTSNRKTHLNAHLATHSKTRVHQCEVCGHSFSHARNMRRHMRLHAPASNLLTCVSLSKLQCGFRTTRPDKLRDHLFKKHNMKRDTLPSKHISKLLKSNAVLPNSLSKAFEKQSISTFPNQGNVPSTSSKDFRSDVSLKEKNIPVVERCSESSVAVTSVGGVHTTDRLSFQTSSSIYEVRKCDPDSKISNIENMKSEDRGIFQPSQHMVKDCNGDSGEGAFSVLLSSPSMVELPQIQTLQSHTGQSMKDQEVSEIADNFHSGFLIGHDILLEKESTSEPCLNTKGDIAALQTSMLPMSDQKVMSVSASVADQQLSLVGTSNVSSLSYSSQCTLSNSQDNVALEVANPCKVEMPSSSVQVSVSNPMCESSFQEKPVKEEQCMESLTILEFMLDNVTS